MTGPQDRGPVPDGMARCARCRAVKSVERFSPHPRKRNGRSSWCRDCATAATRSWRAATPDRQAAINERRRVKHHRRECPGCFISFTPKRRDSTSCCGTCADHRRAYGPYTDAGADAHRRTHQEDRP